MKLETFNKYCASLPATNTVVQWGGAHVWKVGDKIFAMASLWGKTGFQDQRHGLSNVDRTTRYLPVTLSWPI